MSEGDESQIRAAFDELRNQVESDVDTDAALARLRGRDAGGPMRSTVTLLALLGAVAAVAIVIAAVAFWPSTTTTELVSSGARHDGTAQGAGGQGDPEGPSDVRCETKPVVYVTPTATEEQIAAIGAAIDEIGVSKVFVSQSDAYEEFRRLFEDQPDFVESLDATDIPASFRLVGGHPLDPAAIEHLEMMPGFYQLDLPERYPCPGDGSTTTSLHDADQAATTSDAPTTTIHPPQFQSPPTSGVLDVPADVIGELTGAFENPLFGCLDRIDRTATTDPNSECPGPDPGSVGTITIGRQLIQVTVATSFWGCGPTRARVPISFSEVITPPADHVGERPVSVWIAKATGDLGSSQPVAEHIAVGSCG